MAQKDAFLYLEEVLIAKFVREEPCEHSTSYHIYIYIIALLYNALNQKRTRNFNVVR